MRKYNPEKLKKVIKENIDKNPNIVFVTDVCALIKVGSRSYYNIFNKEDQEEIGEWLDNNRTKMKGEIRQKLFDNQSPTALIALYRLLATSEERAYLNLAKEESDSLKNVQKIKINIE